MSEDDFASSVMAGVNRAFAEASAADQPDTIIMPVGRYEAIRRMWQDGTVADFRRREPHATMPMMDLIAERASRVMLEFSRRPSP